MACLEGKQSLRGTTLSETTTDIYHGDFPRCSRTILAFGAHWQNRERGIQRLSCVVVGYQEKDDLHLYQQGEIIFQIIPNNIIEEKEVDFFFQKR